jgi:F-type H+-transporting ATPase subunit b
MFDAEFWVAASFVIFLGVLGYFGIHKKIAEALDQRRDRIKAELDEAQRLREEAHKLLRHYLNKQREAEGEAELIISGAKAEAERMALDAKAKMEEFVARRTNMAETKIAQAEAQAMADVRAAAAEAAVAAAESILREATKGKVAEELLGAGINDVKNKLN